LVIGFEVVNKKKKRRRRHKKFIIDIKIHKNLALSYGEVLRPRDDEADEANAGALLAWSRLISEQTTSGRPFQYFQWLISQEELTRGLNT
jgi:hypothetical protein